MSDILQKLKINFYFYNCCEIRRLFLKMFTVQLLVFIGFIIYNIVFVYKETEVDKMYFKANARRYTFVLRMNILCHRAFVNVD